MREAFLDRLLVLARANPRITLITGDLGFGVLDAFARELPSQFINAGVAEQNMTAIAAGMALEGHVAFTYSIGNFPTLRCLEQIRNDVAYHEANVRIVSVGGGFSYGQLGMSHHATEDLSIMRALPGIAVCTPGSNAEARALTDVLVERPGPAYLRLERSGADSPETDSLPVEFGKARMLRNGDALTLIGAGGIMGEVYAAAGMLAERGIACRVLSIHTLKPIDSASIRAAARETGGICTVEENTVLGGLGGAIAEVCLSSGDVPRRFRMLGIDDRYVSAVGDQAYLRRTAGLDAAGIAATVAAMLSA